MTEMTFDQIRAEMRALTLKQRVAKWVTFLGARYPDNGFAPITHREVYKARHTRTAALSDQPATVPPACGEGFHDWEYDGDVMECQRCGLRRPSRVKL